MMAAHGTEPLAVRRPTNEVPAEWLKKTALVAARKKRCMPAASKEIFLKAGHHTHTASAGQTIVYQSSTIFFFVKPQ